MLFDGFKELFQGVIVLFEGFKELFKSLIVLIERFKELFESFIVLFGPAKLHVERSFPDDGASLWRFMKRV